MLVQDTATQTLIDMDDVQAKYLISLGLAQPAERRPPDASSADTGALAGEFDPAVVIINIP